jgi:hypothetical protein
MVPPGQRSQADSKLLGRVDELPESLHSASFNAAQPRLEAHHVAVASISESWWNGD